MGHFSSGLRELSRRMNEFEIETLHLRWLAFSGKQKERDEIISWCRPSMVYHFVLECEDEDSGQSLAKSIVKLTRFG